MTWHFDIVPPAELVSLLTRIRNLGGTIECSAPAPDGVHVTWTSGP
jgi:hypothetical protein